MPNINLQAYWGATSFNLECHELKELRAYLANRPSGMIVVGAWSFEWKSDVLYFSSGGIPGKYYIDMTLKDIIAVIDAAIAQFC
ncbi:hypothetical protein [Pseudomonas sp. BW7P1]|uniref:hypothetical protein n=1 Tax=Pseudomonas TaxID=286 RepID=UPI0021ADDBDF|nr:hypothetical protein [Pseudomonas sp. BW7P1]UWI63949.1 hypothetical protein NWV16_11285 [Pseudomonas sp. BW7P1]